MGILASKHYHTLSVEGRSVNKELPVPLLDAKAVAEAAAEVFIASAVAAVERKGRFVVALAGGSTPRAMYELLATPEYSERVPWESVFVTFGDERNVPNDHPDSNVRMAKEAFLDHVPIPEEHILCVEAGGPQPARAAWFYEEKLRALFPDQPVPRFDLILLGLGTDGHTASLFPETGALTEHEKWFTANWLPQSEEWRLTLTYPVINQAALILFLVTGESKASIAAEVFGHAPHDQLYPAERVQPADGTLEVFLDQSAASKLMNQDDSVSVEP